nr:unnamed protein product [Spirometra erinaceieuropaei]
MPPSAICSQRRTACTKTYVDHPTDDNRAAFYRSRRLELHRLREMQDAWTARKSEEIHGGGPITSEASSTAPPPTISDAVIVRLPQVETNVDPDVPSSLHETCRAVQTLPSGKAPGSDAIPAEIDKRGGPQLMDHLTVLFREMWCEGEVPQDF